MAFSENFTISQSIGLPSIINLTDTSTGTDAAITQRRVYLIRDNNAYLVPSGTTTDYIAWAIANPTKSIDALTKDFALNIRVDWLDVTNVVLYTKTILSDFRMYNSDFNYSLVNDEANGLASLNSQNWLMSRMKLYVALNDSYTSVVDMGSITNGQNANDRGTYLRENLNLFY